MKTQHLEQAAPLDAPGAGSPSGQIAVQSSDEIAFLACASVLCGLGESRGDLSYDPYEFVSPTSFERELLDDVKEALSQKILYGEAK